MIGQEHCYCGKGLHLDESCTVAKLLPDSDNHNSATLHHIPSISSLLNSKPSSIGLTLPFRLLVLLPIIVPIPRMPLHPLHDSTVISTLVLLLHTELGHVVS